MDLFQKLGIIMYRINCDGGKSLRLSGHTSAFLTGILQFSVTEKRRMEVRMQESPTREPIIITGPIQ